MYVLLHQRAAAATPQSTNSNMFICVIHHGRLLVTQPAFPYRASSELKDRSAGRAETTSHTLPTGTARPQPLDLHPTPICCCG